MFCSTLLSLSTILPSFFEQKCLNYRGKYMFVRAPISIQRCTILFPTESTRFTNCELKNEMLAAKNFRIKRKFDKIFAERQMNAKII